MLSPDPRMLYRSPPPWTLLHDPSGIHEAKDLPNPHRRKKARLEEDSESNQARESMLAKNGVRNVLDMVQRRVNPPSDIKRHPEEMHAANERSVKNPFARTQQPRSSVQKQDRPRRPDVQNGVASQVEEHDEPRLKKDRTALRPLLSLPVPDFKSVLPKAMKAPAPKRKDKSKGLTQMTLSGMLGPSNAKKGSS